jgi:hypothetical protein
MKLASVSICNIHTSRNPMSGSRLEHRARLGGGSQLYRLGKTHRNAFHARRRRNRNVLNEI